MTHALTTTAARDLTVTEVQSIQRVIVKRARSKSEIIDRIREASAAIEDIRLFIRDLGPVLDKSDLVVVEYALARAYYREGRPLSVRQVAILCQQSIKQIHNHIRFLGFQMREVLTNDEATRIMCRIGED